MSYRHVPDDIYDDVRAVNIGDSVEVTYSFRDRECLVVGRVVEKDERGLTVSDRPRAKTLFGRLVRWATSTGIDYEDMMYLDILENSQGLPKLVVA